MAVLATPLPLFKVTFFFQQNADLVSGWSENFYNGRSDFAAVKSAADVLLSKLNQFKGFGTYPVAMRISDLLGFRQAQIFRISDSENLDGTPAVYSDYPDTAVLMKLSGEGKTVVNQWMRGIKERTVNTLRGRMLLTSEDQRHFNAIKSTLTDGTFSWKLRVLDPAEKFNDITSITAQGRVTVTGGSFLEGDRVRISRAKGIPYANRIWKITDVQGGSFQLVGWAPPYDPVPPYTGNGVCKRLVFKQQSISDVRLDRATSHDTGRPFGLRTGRRKRRVI